MKWSTVELVLGASEGLGRISASSANMLGPSCVIDLGSHSIKAGFGNLALGSGWAPDLVEPTATLPEEGRATLLGCPSEDILKMAKN